MERRLILAIFLSFLILFLYQLIFIKSQKTVPRAPEQVSAVEQVEPKKEKPEPAQPKRATAESRSVAEGEIVVADKEELLTIDTPLFSAVWSNRGGVLRSWKLKKHLKRLPTRGEPQKEPLDLVPEAAAKTGIYPFSLKTSDPEITEKINTALYRVEAGPLTLSGGEKSSFIFEYSDGNTAKIIKEVVFNGDNYNFEIRTRVEISGQEVVPLLLWGPGISSLIPEELKQKFSANRGVAFLVDKKVLRLQEKKIGLENEAIHYARLDWAGYEENYFAALFLLDPGRSQAFAFRIETTEEQADGRTAVIPYFYLAFSHPAEAYIGPKEYARLAGYGRQAKKIINFGFFGGIAELLLAATRYFHKFFPNWGLAIIIMTLIIKILFFPLTYSSTKSMARMQEIQPKIKALRAKYKKAKQDMEQRRQMNEELMRLYKEHGINPASGCLPLLIQLPVFWGFFRMLVVAVEFRHSPFVFWIKDLSVRDPYYVTPILMGITQYISQKMTPSTADPAQQKMMLLMPFIFTIFFMNFQAGLVLYWLTNNVLQIAQQAIMNRMMAGKREIDGKRRKK
jgi:YidC/Oxa1 family membrane protein insertase